MYKELRNFRLWPFTHVQLATIGFLNDLIAVVIPHGLRSVTALGPERQLNFEQRPGYPRKTPNRQAP